MGCGRYLCKPAPALLGATGGPVSHTLATPHQIWVHNYWEVGAPTLVPPNKASAVPTHTRDSTAPAPAPIGQRPLAVFLTVLRPHTVALVSKQDICHSFHLHQQALGHYTSVAPQAGRLEN